MLNFNSIIETLIIVNTDNKNNIKTNKFVIKRSENDSVYLFEYYRCSVCNITILFISINNSNRSLHYNNNVFMDEEYFPTCEEIIMNNALE